MNKSAGFTWCMCNIYGIMKMIMSLLYLVEVYIKYDDGLAISFGIRYTTIRIRNIYDSEFCPSNMFHHGLLHVWDLLRNVIELEISTQSFRETNVNRELLANAFWYFMTIAFDVDIFLWFCIQTNTLNSHSKEFSQGLTRFSSAEIYFLRALDQTGKTPHFRKNKCCKSSNAIPNEMSWIIQLECYSMFVVTVWNHIETKFHTIHVNSKTIY